MSKYLAENKVDQLAGLSSWLRKNILSSANQPAIEQKPGWIFLDGPKTPHEIDRELLWVAITELGDRMFPLQFPWLYDTLVEFSHACHSAQQLFIHSDFDPNEFALLDRVLQEGMTFIDVGANAGLYTVYASKKIGPSGDVYSFEPSEREFATLSRNIALNGLMNVSAFKMAVGDKEGQATLSIAPKAYDGMNSLLGLSILENFPNIRYTTDQSKYEWCSFYGAETKISIEAANQIEIALYSDEKFAFNLSHFEIDTNSAALKPWRTDIEQEVHIEPIVNFEESIARAAISTFGKISVEKTNQGLLLEGEPKSGVIFRWLIEPEASAEIRVQGKPASVPPLAIEETTVTTLDRLVESKNIPSVDVVKIDVESYEHAVVAGGRRMIEKFQPLILIEVLPQAAANELTDTEFLQNIFAEFDYVLFDVSGPTPRRIKLEDVRSPNVVAVPPRFIDIVETRAATAHKDKVQAL